ncbi:MAG: hypothetical protein A2075_01115 [Geobacteraceae bacterium GWC2_58_44]|nr:MAG: hypothetical protein A2075_01115 [Geobacteraceae bacterium GWC2_58_44]HBG04781.1 hypothetical protein [Geobacter sp.]
MLGASTTHPTLQDAYNKATEGETIFAQAKTFVENFYCNKKIRARLFGGKDSNYAATTGFTTIRGTMIIRDGRVDISGFTLK